MLKIVLRHPSGLEIEFEGDKEAFDRFAEFLTDDLGEFVNALTPANTGNQALAALSVPKSDEGTPDGEETTGQEHGALGDNGRIDPRAVAARIETVGATTDIDRVTVIAQAAIDAGLEGIDYETIDDLYGDMGIPKPARFAKAFSNAKTRGFVKSVKYGVWAPTVQGENYARYGRKPQRRPPRRGGPNGVVGGFGELVAGDAEGS